MTFSELELEMSDVGGLGQAKNDNEVSDDTTVSVSSVSDIENKLRASVIESKLSGSYSESYSSVSTKGENGLSVLDEWLASTVVMLSGVLTVFVFYQMSLLWDALKNVWPEGEKFSNALGASQYLTATIVSFMMINVNGVRVELFYLTAALYTTTGILFPLIVQYNSGMDRFIQARILLCACSCVTGVADSLLTIVGYGVAGLLPRSRVPLRAAGCSLSGFIPWLSFQLLSPMTSFFPRNLEGQTRLIWVFMNCGILLSIPMVVCVAVLQRRKWFQDLFR